MKYLIITVAGTATRFNRDTKEETLKCLYYTDEPQYALLAQLLKNCGEYDKYILVGATFMRSWEDLLRTNSLVMAKK